MNAIQTAATLLSVCLGLCAGRTAADVVVTLRELPVDRPGTTLSDVATDGSVLGWALGSDLLDVARWRPDGTLEYLGNRMQVEGPRAPLMSPDGRKIVATRTYYPTDPELDSIGRPVLWGGGTTWTSISDLVLPSAEVLGTSDSGDFLVGKGLLEINLPDDVLTPAKPWIWSSGTGQRVLSDVPGWNNGIAAGVSNDGRVVVGAGYDDPPRHITRYGAIWVDGVGRQLFDADQRPVGQAVACNSDCSVVVGTGLLWSSAGSNQAWRWTAQTGIQFLGEVSGNLPGFFHAASDTNEDGTMIAGYYHALAASGNSLNARGFVWTAADGIVDLVDFLAAHGIEYGADLDNTPVMAMSRDGRYLAVDGRKEPGFVSKPALVRIDSDAVFAHGFEASGAG